MNDRMKYLAVYAAIIVTVVLMVVALSNGPLWGIWR